MGVQLWHKALPVNMLSILLSMLSSLACRIDKLVLASACSGSDIFMKVSNCVLSYYNTQHNLSFRSEHAMAVEVVAKKQRFLKTQCPGLKHLFDNVDVLGSLRAPCLKTFTNVVILESNVFVSGFSCTRRSKQNNSRSTFKDCLQHMVECQTTATFFSILNHLLLMKPMLVILEHVADLLEKAEESLMSDAGFVMTALKKAGYSFARHFIMEAQESGSISRRKRLYFLAIRMQDCMMPHISAAELFAQNLLSSMRTTTGDASNFIDMVYCKPDLASNVPPPKVSRDYANYKEVHESLYLEHALQWPPSLADLAAFRVRDIRSRRAHELAYYCHMRFTIHELPSCTRNRALFLYGNLSLERLTGWPTPVHNPWSLLMPTIKSHSTILVRYVVDDEIIIRELSVQEYMHMMGWSESMWASETPTYVITDRELAVSLVGNAFSGFSVGLVYVTGLALAGMRPEHLGLVTVASDKCEASDSESESANCDSLGYSSTVYSSS